jgi:RNA polymerase subunit RPABC4/transcription elongation factor Spt4
MSDERECERCNRMVPVGNHECDVTLTGERVGGLTWEDGETTAKYERGKS